MGCWSHVERYHGPLQRAIPICRRLDGSGVRNTRRTSTRRHQSEFNALSTTARRRGNRNAQARPGVVDLPHPDRAAMTHPRGLRVGASTLTRPGRGGLGMPGLVRDWGRIKGKPTQYLYKNHTSTKNNWSGKTAHPGRCVACTPSRASRLPPPGDRTLSGTVPRATRPAVASSLPAPRSAPPTLTLLQSSNTQ